MYTVTKYWNYVLWVHRLLSQLQNSKVLTTIHFKIHLWQKKSNVSMRVQMLKMAVLSGKTCLDKGTQTCLQVAEKVLMEEKENTLFWHVYTFKFIFNWRIMLYNILYWFLPYQRESAIGIHMAPFSWTSLSPHTPLGCHRAWDLSSLCHTANSHWPSLLHMVMYMFQCYYLNSSHPLLP